MIRLGMERNVPRGTLLVFYKQRRRHVPPGTFIVSGWRFTFLLQRCRCSLCSCRNNKRPAFHPSDPCQEGTFRETLGCCSASSSERSRLRIFLREYFCSRNNHCSMFLQERCERVLHTNSLACTAILIAFEMACGLCCGVALLLLTIEWDALLLLPTRRVASVRLRPPST